MKHQGDGHYEKRRERAIMEISLITDWVNLSYHCDKLIALSQGPRFGHGVVAVTSPQNQERFGF